MTFSAVRVPVIRVFVTFAFTVWVLAMAVPECHVFAHSAVAHAHAHIEASGPTVASTASVAILADRHQHAAAPDRHLPTAAVLAALPRFASLLAFLLVAVVLVLMLPLAAALGGGLRAPPVALLPVCTGREKITRFGIDRN
ncbi:hypothetical protein OHB12_31580 [Nocardia sp. NBC_01730]|uniref:hypothetical protein n=1 Tax=Nocardia sp. NBC_01730 TaxID=2975998 RepID=UPI002E0EC662|nr:hypothetical protein OHB12_31580 [Nocardia sp. NBC_01730]